MRLQALMFDVKIWVMARVYHRLLDRWSRVFGGHDGIVIGSNPEGISNHSGPYNTTGRCARALVREAKP